MSPQQLAFILVGDHLGQVKKVLLPSNEISLIQGCAAPDRSNPVVSIEPTPEQAKQLIANKQGDIFIYNCIRDEIEARPKADDSLVKALPLGSGAQAIHLYDKRINFGLGESGSLKQKKGQITNGKVNGNTLAVVGRDIPLRLFDIERRNKTFEASPPDKDWLGVRPECIVAGLDFTGGHRVVTCSKSDSVIRIYDPKAGKDKPVINVDVNQVAFNEHAESAHFHSVVCVDPSDHQIVVGSNVGQMLAIDLRFNVKLTKGKKKLQPRTYKILGGFKGARGGSIKDIKVAQTEDGPKVISCSLDRYLRIHSMSRTLDGHVYMTTKPHCCSMVNY